MFRHMFYMWYGNESYSEVSYSNCKCGRNAWNWRMLEWMHDSSFNVLCVCVYAHGIVFKLLSWMFVGNTCSLLFCELYSCSVHLYLPVLVQLSMFYMENHYMNISRSHYILDIMHPLGMIRHNCAVVDYSVSGIVSKYNSNYVFN